MSVIDSFCEEPAGCSTDALKKNTLGLITFDSVNYRIPEHYGLETDTKYILSCFTSNIYIQTERDDPTQFVVNQTYGDPLDIMKEYVLIRPKY